MSYFFVPDRKSFYYRSYVPKELRNLLNGRREVWRSLFCLDKGEAKRRAADWDHRTQRVYMTLCKQGNRMTEDQRNALVAEWLDAELEYAEDCRVTAGRMSENQMEAQLEGLSIMQDEALEDMQANDYQYTRIESRRWQGEEYTPLLRQQINGHSTHAAPLPKPAASATGPLFMEAVDGYLRENPRTERSTRALKSELRRFVTVIGGDRPVSS